MSSGPAAMSDRRLLALCAATGIIAAIALATIYYFPILYANRTVGQRILSNFHRTPEDLVVKDTEARSSTASVDASFQTGRSYTVVVTTDRVSAATEGRVTCGSGPEQAFTVKPGRDRSYHYVPIDGSPVSKAITCVVAFGPGPALVLSRLDVIEYSLLYTLVLAGLLVLLVVSTAGLVWLSRARLIEWIRQALGAVASGTRRSNPADAVLIVAVFVCFAVLVARSLSQPFGIVFGDESVYSLLARSAGGPTPAAVRAFLGGALPNTAYFYLFSPLRVLNENFLDGARLLNCVLAALTVVPMAAVLRRFIPRGMAVAVAALFMAGISGVYAGVFMPEALFVLGYWILLALLVTHVNSKEPVWAGYAGVTAGVLFLVKPHALTFVILAVVVLAGFAFMRSPYTTGPEGRRGLLMFCVTTLGTYCVLKVLFGESVTDILGRTYSGVMAKTAQTTGGSTVGAHLVFRLAAGHIALILSIYGLPLIASLWICFARPGAEDVSRGRTARFLAILAISTIAVIVVGTSQFSIAMSHGSTTELPNRVHSRYYGFALPLLIPAVVVINERLAKASARNRTILRVACGGCAAIIVMAALFVNRTLFANVVDSPEFLPLISGSSVVARSVPYIMALMLVIAAVRYGVAARVFPIVYVCYCIVAGAIASEKLLEPAPLRDVQADVAAARSMIPAEWRDVGRIVAPSWDMSVWAALLQLQSDAEVTTLDRTPTVNWEELKKGKRWLLVLGGIKVPSDVPPLLVTPRVQLMSVGPALDVPVLENTTGMKLAGVAPAYFIDRIGVPGSPVSAVVKATRADNVVVAGWAVDSRAQSSAAGVQIVVDGRPFRAEYGMARPDVASALNRPAYKFSGFNISIPARMLTAGPHTAAIRIVSADRSYFYSADLPPLFIEESSCESNDSRSTNMPSNQ